MISKIFFTLLFSLLSLSCTKKDFTQAECETLSMKKFKGHHRESHQFDNYCKQYKIHYSQKRCKTALNQLILGANLEKLQKAHGLDIAECFTKNDLKKFGPKGSL
ncbi:hypothetical protein BIY24_11425 [Halobacteriovorax marinus]|uniref:hypothetical protein n=1 Tax=Halobacteriovorax marinus TaxID=97084 RepID=UPI000BC3449E|nr:hypothetical protein [Halobacteriovorax marinus]ATH08538.1 hypothetical protein BIY24_11425 [Halobacteriovorax marinus]